MVHRWEIDAANGLKKRVVRIEKEPHEAGDVRELEG